MAMTRKPRPVYLTRDQVAEMVAVAIGAERIRSEQALAGVSAVIHGAKGPLKISTFPMMQKK